VILIELRLIILPRQAQKSGKQHAPQEKGDDSGIRLPQADFERIIHY
jgi:hypothetical protein